MNELHLKWFKDLRAEGVEKFDPEVIDGYVEWWKSSGQKEQLDEVEGHEPSAAKLPHALTKRLGLLPRGEKLPTDGPGTWGYVERSGLFVSIVFTPVQIDPELSQLAEWLYAQGGIHLTYGCMLGTVEQSEGGLPD